MPKTGDAVLPFSHQRTSLEHHIPFSGSRLAGDHIQERGLAGPIGTDHGPQLTQAEG